MLSPRTSAQPLDPMKSRPIRKAWAMPSGFGCTAYWNWTPKREPSPSSCWKRGRSSGVENEKNFADSRQHEGRERVVDHRLVIHRQQALGDRMRNGIEARARSSGEDDALVGWVG